MEVQVVNSENVPEGCLLSLSAGGSRRQAPLIPRQKFAFSGSSAAAAVAAGGSGLKVDVLSVQGSARLATSELTPALIAGMDTQGASGGVHRIEVPFNPQAVGASSSSPEAPMRVGLTIRAVPQGGGSWETSRLLASGLGSARGSEDTSSSKEQDSSSIVSSVHTSGTSLAAQLKPPLLPAAAKTVPGPAHHGTPRSSRRHHVALEARSYLEEHSILPFVERMLRTLVQDRPVDPWGTIRTMLPEGMPPPVDCQDVASAQAKSATADAAVNQTWRMLPSVGTWYLGRPTARFVAALARVAEAAAAIREEPAAEARAAAQELEEQVKPQLAEATAEWQDELDAGTDSRLEAGERPEEAPVALPVHEEKTQVPSSDVKAGVADVLQVPGKSSLLSGFGKAKTEVQGVTAVEFVIERLDYDRVLSSPDLCAGLLRQLQEVIARKANVHPLRVEVDVGRGSVIVCAAIRCPTLLLAEEAKALLDANQGDLLEAAEKQVLQVPGIQEAILGGGGLQMSRYSSSVKAKLVPPEDWSQRQATSSTIAPDPLDPMLRTMSTTAPSAGNSFVTQSTPSRWPLSGMSEDIPTGTLEVRSGESSGREVQILSSALAPQHEDVQADPMLARGATGEQNDDKQGALEETAKPPEAGLQLVEPKRPEPAEAKLSAPSNQALSDVARPLSSNLMQASLDGRLGGILADLRQEMPDEEVKAMAKVDESKAEEEEAQLRKALGSKLMEATMDGSMSQIIQDMREMDNQTLVQAAGGAPRTRAAEVPAAPNSAPAQAAPPEAPAPHMPAIEPLLAETEPLQAPAADVQPAAPIDQKPQDSGSTSTMEAFKAPAPELPHVPVASVSQKPLASDEASTVEVLKEPPLTEPPVSLAVNVEETATPEAPTPSEEVPQEVAEEAAQEKGWTLVNEAVELAQVQSGTVLPDEVEVLQAPMNEPSLIVESLVDVDGGGTEAPVNDPSIAAATKSRLVSAEEAEPLKVRSPNWPEDITPEDERLVAAKLLQQCVPQVRLSSVTSTGTSPMLSGVASRAPTTLNSSRDPTVVDTARGVLAEPPQPPAREPSTVESVRDYPVPPPIQAWPGMESATETTKAVRPAVVEESAPEEEAQVEEDPGLTKPAPAEQVREQTLLEQQRPEGTPPKEIAQTLTMQCMPKVLLQSLGPSTSTSPMTSAPTSTRTASVQPWKIVGNAAQEATVESSIASVVSSARTAGAAPTRDSATGEANQDSRISSAGPVSSLDFKQLEVGGTSGRQEMQTGAHSGLVKAEDSAAAAAFPARTGAEGEEMQLVYTPSAEAKSTQGTFEVESQEDDTQQRSAATQEVPEQEVPPPALPTGEKLDAEPTIAPDGNKQAQTSRSHVSTSSEAVVAAGVVESAAGQAVLAGAAESSASLEEAMLTSGQEEAPEAESVRYSYGDVSPQSSARGFVDTITATALKAQRRPSSRATPSMISSAAAVPTATKAEATQDGVGAAEPAQVSTAGEDAPPEPPTRREGDGEGEAAAGGAAEVQKATLKGMADEPPAAAAAPGPELASAAEENSVAAGVVEHAAGKALAGESRGSSAGLEEAHSFAEISPQSSARGYIDSLTAGALAAQRQSSRRPSGSVISAASSMLNECGDLALRSPVAGTVVAEEISMEDLADVLAQASPRQETQPQKAEAMEMKELGSVTFKLEGLDYSELHADPALLAAFDKRVRGAIAEAAGEGVLPDDVDLVLSAGSVVVAARIRAPSGKIQNEERIPVALASTQSLLEKVLKEVHSIEGINKACNGPLAATTLDAEPIRVLLPTEDSSPPRPGTQSSVVPDLPAVHRTEDVPDVVSLTDGMSTGRSSGKDFGVGAHLSSRPSGTASLASQATKAAGVPGVEELLAGPAAAAEAPKLPLPAAAIQPQTQQAEAALLAGGVIDDAVKSAEHGTLHPEDSRPASRDTEVITRPASRGNEDVHIPPPERVTPGGRLESIFGDSSFAPSVVPSAVPAAGEAAPPPYASPTPPASLTQISVSGSVEAEEAYADLAFSTTAQVCVSAQEDAGEVALQDSTEPEQVKAALPTVAEPPAQPPLTVPAAKPEEAAAETQAVEDLPSVEALPELHVRPISEAESMAMTDESKQSSARGLVDTITATALTEQRRPSAPTPSMISATSEAAADTGVPPQPVPVATAAVEEAAESVPQLPITEIPADTKASPALPPLALVKLAERHEKTEPSTPRKVAVEATVQPPAEDTPVDAEVGKASAALPPLALGKLAERHEKTEPSTPRKAAPPAAAELPSQPEPAADVNVEEPAVAAEEVREPTAPPQEEVAVAAGVVEHALAEAEAAERSAGLEEAESCVCGNTDTSPQSSVRGLMDGVTAGALTAQRQLSSRSTPSMLTDLSDAQAAPPEEGHAQHQEAPSPTAAAPAVPPAESVAAEATLEATPAADAEATPPPVPGGQAKTEAHSEEERSEESITQEAKAVPAAGESTIPADVACGGGAPAAEPAPEDTEVLPELALEATAEEAESLAISHTIPSPQSSARGLADSLAVGALTSQRFSRETTTMSATSGQLENLTAEGLGAQQARSLATTAVLSDASQQREEQEPKAATSIATANVPLEPPLAEAATEACSVVSDAPLESQAAEEAAQERSAVLVREAVEHVQAIPTPAHVEAAAQDIPAASTAAGDTQEPPALDSVEEVVLPDLAVPASIAAESLVECQTEGSPQSSTRGCLDVLATGALQHDGAAASRATPSLISASSVLQDPTAVRTSAAEDAANQAVPPASEAVREDENISPAADAQDPTAEDAPNQAAPPASVAAREDENISPATDAQAGLPDPVHSQQQQDEGLEVALPAIPLTAASEAMSVVNDQSEPSPSSSARGFVDTLTAGAITRQRTVSRGTMSLISEATGQSGPSEEPLHEHEEPSARPAADVELGSSGPVVSEAPPVAPLGVVEEEASEDTVALPSVPYDVDQAPSEASLAAHALAGMAAQEAAAAHAHEKTEAKSESEPFSASSSRLVKPSEFEASAVLPPSGSKTESELDQTSAVTSVPVDSTKENALIPPPRSESAKADSDLEQSSVASSAAADTLKATTLLPAIDEQSDCPAETCDASMAEAQEAAAEVVAEAAVPQLPAADEQKEQDPNVATEADEKALQPQLPPPGEKQVDDHVKTATAADSEKAVSPLPPLALGHIVERQEKTEPSTPRKAAPPPQSASAENSVAQVAAASSEKAEASAGLPPLALGQLVERHEKTEPSTPRKAAPAPQPAHAPIEGDVEQSSVAASGGQETAAGLVGEIEIPEASQGEPTEDAKSEFLLEQASVASPVGVKLPSEAPGTEASQAGVEEVSTASSPSKAPTLRVEGLESLRSELSEVPRLPQHASAAVQDVLAKNWSERNQGLLQEGSSTSSTAREAEVAFSDASIRRVVKAASSVGDDDTAPSSARQLALASEYARRAEQQAIAEEEDPGHPGAAVSREGEPPPEAVLETAFTEVPATEVPGRTMDSEQLSSIVNEVEEAAKVPLDQTIVVTEAGAETSPTSGVAEQSDEVKELPLQRVDPGAELPSLLAGSTVSGTSQDLRSGMRLALLKSNETGLLASTLEAVLGVEGVIPAGKPQLEQASVVSQPGGVEEAAAAAAAAPAAVETDGHAEETQSTTPAKPAEEVAFQDADVTLSDVPAADATAPSSADVLLALAEAEAGVDELHQSVTEVDEHSMELAAQAAEVVGSPRDFQAIGTLHEEEVEDSVSEIPKELSQIQQLDASGQAMATTSSGPPRPPPGGLPGGPQPESQESEEATPPITSVKELETVCREAVTENEHLRAENDSLRMELQQLLALASPLSTPASSTSGGKSGRQS